jgi:hypothetical protein
VPTRSPATRRSYTTIRAISGLQDSIRNAINVTDHDGRKLGVEPSRLKRAIVCDRIPASRITIRAQRLTAGSDLWADYKLWLDGELLFHLKLVPWGDGYVGARWHVKRHPEATWWRSSRRGRRRRKGS